MTYLLGIDVGGTKYHVRVRPEGGQDIDLIVPSPGNLHALGTEKFVREISRVVRDAQKRVGRGTCTGVCMGVSGLDDSKSVRALNRALAKTAWWKKIDPGARQLTNDIQIGLRAGTDAEAAIALISGTGSNGYGIDVDGNEAWVSGRGHLMSDEGSGYALGVACLRAARRAEDGRGQSTMMLPLLLRRFHVGETGDLMPKLYHSDFGKKDVAELNDIVEEAAKHGDRLAGTLLDEAAHELIVMAKALHRRLKFTRDPVDVVLIGGTINKNRELMMRFLKKARRIRWMHALPLPNDPVEGALRMLESSRKVRI